MSQIADITEAQALRYFESRLQGNRLRKAGSGYMAQCIWHKDRTASLSLNVEKKVWRCHACNIGGGLIDFEKRFASCDAQTAMKNIAEIVGMPQLAMGNGPEAVYPYEDEQGNLLFQVVRYPGKKFTQRRPDGKGGWVYSTDKTRMVLYRFRDVITASEVLICEGEKDCDNVRRAIGREAGEDGGPEDRYNRVAVTTSPRGAGKWREEFNQYFAGKKVVIFPDNDEPGRKHAEKIAAGVYRFAAGVKVVALPDVPEKGDLSDYLKGHTLVELLKVIAGAPMWKPTGEAERAVLVSVEDFLRNAPDAIDWMVEGVIQRGCNGMFVARPKAGKSFSVADLSLALASGKTWVDFYIPQRAKVALVSREDNPALTAWRLRRLMTGRGLTYADLAGYFYLNSRAQTSQLMLDDKDQTAELVENLKRREIEFLILDVFRRLHGADENDNTEMQKVIDIVSSICEEVHCSVCIIHHDNKREDATLTERIRGASAIAGFAEWICGIKVVNIEAPKHEWVREMECEIKSAISPDNVHYKIDDTDGEGDGTILKRVHWTPPETVRRRKKSEAAVASEGSSNEDTPF